MKNELKIFIYNFEMNCNCFVRKGNEGYIYTYVIRWVAILSIWVNNDNILIWIIIIKNLNIKGLKYKYTNKDIMSIIKTN